MSYTFDIANKIIQLTTTDELDMMDLYSRWKDEVASTLAGAEQAIRVVKEPLAGSVFIGPYYFIMNNWQIRPLDTNHELIVAGAVVQDTTSSLLTFKLDNLTSNVQILRTVATEVQVVETVAAVTEADMDQIVDKVWDEPLTGSTHNIATSAGRRLRQASVWLSGEGQLSGTHTLTTVETNIGNGYDDFYNDQTFVFVSGVLAGQARIITAYDSSTGEFTFDEALSDTPSDGDEFAVFANHEHPISQIQAGLAKTTELDAAEAAIIAEVDANEAKIDLLETKTQADARQTILVAEHDATQSAIANLDSDLQATPQEIYDLFTQNDNADKFKSTGNSKANELARIIQLLKKLNTKR